MFVSISSSFLFIVICLHNLSQTRVDGCMPGFEDEREKLQEYLGIEWIPHGLDHDAHSHRKHIRRASDLDCNFDDADKCQWRNAHSDDVLDTIDFHLFQKTDHTDFPALQVRPGPSKVAEGEKMIFTGHKRSKEHSAIWYSSPIRCQNTTGKLTFTYWVYNEARVEVLLLHVDDETHQFSAVPERPFVDCGSVQVDTECDVMIEPHAQTFSIAIRAYNINNPDGSFVIIDNIRYEASLCKTSIELGKHFHKSPMITAAQGTAINTAMQLTCVDWDESCRWRSIPPVSSERRSSDEPMANHVWMRASGAEKPMLWFNATASYTLPDHDFAILYIEMDSRKGINNLLLSDAITCVTDRTANLTFRFWQTQELQSRVCAFTMQLTEIECHPLMSAQSPGPISIAFTRATRDFIFVFQVVSFNDDYDNFLAIDDVRYDAEMCSESVDAWDIGERFTTAPLLTSIIDRPVQTESEINCDFDRLANDCIWANDADTSVTQWEIGAGNISAYKWQRLTGYDVMPNGTFAVLRIASGTTTATNLITESIDCLRSSATLTFSYWRTGAISLHFCILEHDASIAIDCQPIESTSPVVVDIPASGGEPFRLAIRAVPVDGAKAMLIVDDLRFRGDICSSSPSAVLSSNGISLPIAAAAASGVRTVTAFGRRRSLIDVNACRLLTCDFNDGNLCLYKSDRLPGSLAKFRVKRGNEDDENGHAPKYAETMLFPRGPTAMFESPTFSLSAASRLHFDYRQLHGIATLFVCQDTLTKQLDSCYPLMKKGDGMGGDDGPWIHDYMELVGSDTKFYFVAKLGDETKMVNLQLDNVRLTDADNVDLC